MELSKTYRRTRREMAFPIIFFTIFWGFDILIILDYFFNIFPDYDPATWFVLFHAVLFIISTVYIITGIYSLYNLWKYGCSFCGEINTDGYCCNRRK